VTAEVGGVPVEVPEDRAVHHVAVRVDAGGTTTWVDGAEQVQPPGPACTQFEAVLLLCAVGLVILGLGVAWWSVTR